MTHFNSGSLTWIICEYVQCVFELLPCNCNVQSGPMSSRQYREECLQPDLEVKSLILLTHATLSLVYYPHVGVLGTSCMVSCICSTRKVQKSGSLARYLIRLDPLLGCHDAIHFNILLLVYMDMTLSHALITSDSGFAYISLQQFFFRPGSPLLSGSQIVRLSPLSLFL